MISPIVGKFSCADFHLQLNRAYVLCLFNIDGFAIAESNKKYYGINN